MPNAIANTISTLITQMREMQAGGKLAPHERDLLDVIHSLLIRILTMVSDGIQPGELDQLITHLGKLENKLGHLVNGGSAKDKVQRIRKRLIKLRDAWDALEKLLKDVSPSERMLIFKLLMETMKVLAISLQGQPDISRGIPSKLTEALDILKAKSEGFESKTGAGGFGAVHPILKELKAILDEIGIELISPIAEVATELSADNVFGKLNHLNLFPHDTEKPVSAAS